MGPIYKMFYIVGRSHCSPQIKKEQLESLITTFNPNLVLEMKGPELFSALHEVSGKLKPYLELESTCLNLYQTGYQIQPIK